MLEPAAPLSPHPHSGSDADVLSAAGGIRLDTHDYPPLLSTDELQRMRTVRRYDILDTPPDGAFDRITALAAHIFRVPIAIVSIVDSERIWFKSHHGLNASEISRAPGLCASAILKEGVHVLPDALLDPVALTNPLVAGQMGLRFYAAAPLTSLDGYNLGTLCVIDYTPRTVTPEELQQLRDLAALVMDQMELRRTARESMAKLIRAKSVAEKANQAKTDFISSMSHDLRSPLNAILGFAQLLDADSALQSDAHKESVSQILQAGWNLLDQINGILDLALTESGELELAPEPVSVAAMLDECQAHVSGQARKYEVTISVSRSAEPYWVFADPARLKQVVTHLLSNAIKFNKSAGTVAVGCTQTADSRVRISVKDSGPGLSAEQQAQLFQPFNRLSKQARAEEGTGIGLALTKRMVELMGGAIGVDSTVGKGCVFWVEFQRLDPLDGSDPTKDKGALR